MKACFSLLAALLLFNFAARAADGNVSLRLVYKADSTVVKGAVVELSPVKNEGKKYRSASNAGGAVAFRNVEYGNYTLKIVFVGYKPVERKVTVNADTVNLGVIRMERQDQRIGDVVVERIAIRTSQKGDTVTYNANAFKVAKDADAQGLLTKLPGVRVVDGKVEAQGETVRKVFVDGKEFFGEDVNSAIKNLPAEAIAKIEVYNKQSDQAEFSGVEDGQGYKAINIVTKTDMSHGQFGKLYAGWGDPDQYIAGGNVNIFSGDHRWSLIGLSNNMNQQNFLNEDILGVVGGGAGGGRGGRGGRGFMVPQQSGISKVNSFGMNYTGKISPKITLQGSYFFNTSDNENTNTTDRLYYSQTDVRQMYLAQTNSGATNYNNRLNARLEWKPNEFHSLMWRPSLSFQSNHSNSHSTTNWGDGRFVDDMLEQYVPFSTIASGGKTNTKGYNVGNMLLYRVRLGKPGRTLSLDGSLNFSDNQSDMDSRSSTEFFPKGTRADSVINQHKLSDSRGMSVRASVNYTEPITVKLSANVQYRYSYNDQPSDRKTYLWDEITQRYLTTEDARLSNVYGSIYTTQSFGPGLSYNEKGKTSANFNVNYQHSSLDGDRTYPAPASKIAHTFENVTYFGRLDRTFSPNNTLRVFLRSSTDNPSVRQLQEVPDVANTQSVSSGNPNLKPSYEHSLYMNYNRSMVASGRTLMAMLGASVTNNYICDSLVQLRPGERFEVPGSDIVMEGGNYSRPVNMDGYRSVRGMVSFGSPILPIRCNLNVNAGFDFNRMPSYINGSENVASTFNYTGGAVLSSNISENLDFTLSYTAGYNTVRNSIDARSNGKYLNQKAEGAFKWVFWAGFTFSTNASYIKYSGISSNFTEEYCLVNALVGKKIFRNQRGEINCGINDILNQNRSYSHSYNSQYVQNSSNITTGRYFGINFIYNLRNFGKRKSAAMPDTERRGGGFPFAPGGGGLPGAGPGMGGARSL